MNFIRTLKIYHFDLYEFSRELSQVVCSMNKALKSGNNGQSMEKPVTCLISSVTTVYTYITIEVW